MQSLQRTHYVTLLLSEIFLLDFSQGGRKKKIDCFARFLQPRISSPCYNADLQV